MQVLDIITWDDKNNRDETGWKIVRSKGDRNQLLYGVAQCSLSRTLVFILMRNYQLAGDGVTPPVIVTRTINWCDCGEIILIISPGSVMVTGPGVISDLHLSLTLF